jgi:hypothetical protein
LQPARFTQSRTLSDLPQRQGIPIAPTQSQGRAPTSLQRETTMTTNGNDREHTSGPDALDAILGGGTERTADRDPQSSDPTGPEPRADASPEQAEQDTDHDFDSGLGEGLGAEDFSATEDDVYDEDQDQDQRSVYSEIRSRRAARRQELKNRLSHKKGLRSRLLGTVLLTAGVVTQLMQFREMLPTDLSAYGLEPNLLIGLGSVLLIAGVVRRQLAWSNYRIDELAYTHQEAQLDVQANLQYLVEHQQHHFERPPAQGEELERVLHAVQRQDDKINNVSRALKMYGKPLMEIANQTAEVSAQLTKLQTELGQLATTTQETFSQLAERTADGSGSIDLAPLQEMTQKLTENLEQRMRALGERLPDTSGLQQQLVRLEASVQALTQRQEDGEVRKSLVRLEDFGKAQTQMFEQLVKAEGLTAETTRLEKQLDVAIGKVFRSVDQMRQQDMSALESGVKDLQRELAGVATATAYLQQSMKGSGAQRPAVQQQAAPPTAAPSSPADSPAPAASDSSTSPSPPDSGSAAAYSTGARSSSGKNVLGAIAKLKNMKK